MALDIFEIRLNKRQESKALELAGKQGNFTLFSGKEGKVRLAAEKEKPRKGETHAATADLSNDYYEWLFSWLGQQGIVPSEQLLSEIEELVRQERALEDAEFVKTVEKVDAALDQAVSKLRLELEGRQQSPGISNKLRNDYRYVLKRLDAKDFKADYVATWTTRVLGETEGLAFSNCLQECRGRFGLKALRCRLYQRIFLDDARQIKPGKSLKWIKVVKP